MLRPTATSVKSLEDYKLDILFDNGEEGVFDVKPYIKGAWFGELGDEDVFKSVFVNGYTVEWGNGQDICPDELYYGSEIIRQSDQDTTLASHVAENAAEYNA